jgi:hypothetical protein
METVRIRDPGWKKVGSGINIPDQHPRSATLLNSSTVEIINYGIFSSHWVRILIPRTDPDQGQPKNADPDPLALALRYGSGSGSFYNQAIKARKTFIPTVL